MRSLLSQSQTPTAPRRAVGFFRSGCSSGCPAELITQPIRTGKTLIKPTLSAVDGSKRRDSLKDCQCPFSVQTACCDRFKIWKRNPLRSLVLNESEIRFFPFFHSHIHRSSNVLVLGQTQEPNLKKFQVAATWITSVLPVNREQSRSLPISRLLARHK